MRILFIALAALLAASGVATAQVAAPSLNPVPIFNNNPSNPAVLSWDMPSRVGATYSKLEVNDPASPANPVAKGDLKGVQAQYVGEYVAVGASFGTLELTDDFGGGKHSDDFSAIQAAVQFGHWISIGVGQEGHKSQDVDPFTPVTSTDEETLPHAGMTLRIAEEFYFGVAGGTAKTQHTDTIGPGPFPEVSRGVMRYGVGYRDSGASGGLHLEAFKEQREAVNDPVLMVVVKEDTTTGGTAEAKLGAFVIGYTASKTEQTDPTGMNPTATQKIKTLSLAWAPEQGLAVSIAASKFEASPNNGPPELKFTTIGAAWLF